MKKIISLVIVSIVFLTGCSLFVSKPSDEVVKYLNKYKNNDQIVIDELNMFLETQELDDDTLEDYREIYLRQYSNLDYEIKEETVNADKAEVEVQVTVFDYYKTNVESGDYFTANQADFVDDDGDINFSKYIAYKVNKMLDTKDRISYTLNIELTKTDDGWEVEPLSNEELTKLHGTFEY